MTDTIAEPRYRGIIDSEYATIAEILSSDFDYCFQTLLRQMNRGPYSKAGIIDLHTNEYIVVMRSFS